METNDLIVSRIPKAFRPWIVIFFLMLLQVSIGIDCTLGNSRTLDPSYSFRKHFPVFGLVFEMENQPEAYLWAYDMVDW